MRKIWETPGGIHPPENKTQSTQTKIARIDMPSEIVLPLNQHIGAPAIPACGVGDSVLKGQLIADAQGFVSAPVHASTSGTVKAIEDRFIPHSSGMKSLCIVIEPDKQDTWCELHECQNYQELPHDVLLGKIRDAGIAGLGGAGFPTAIKLQSTPGQKIHTLILNGTECEPYITADHMLMIEKAEEILLGARLMAHLLHDPEQVLIGIEDNKPDSIATMNAALTELKLSSNDTYFHTIEIISFPTKYPSGGEKQLIQILTGEEVPQGKIPANIGIVVQNIATASTSYRAIRYGEPFVSRITTVVGEALETQQNIDVLLGTPIPHILTAHGYQSENNSRLILGGPMMGFAMEQADLPVIKTTNCILAPSKKELPNPEPAQACIRCGMCAEACPASLLPQQLFWFSQSEDFDNLREHNLFDCIECGACSYVCPSNIPLVQYYRSSKGTIRHLDAEKEQSDRARERFEFRQVRIEKAEEEKELKRAARKKAAEEAKKKLAERSKNEPIQTPSSESQTSVSKNPITPSDDKAKLERTLSSAQSRLERAKKQLADGLTLDQESRDTKKIGTLEARLKEAELKVSLAKENLEKRSDINVSVKSNAATKPLEKQQKVLSTIEKRIETAKIKLKQAQEEQSPMVDALTLGIQKLEEKHKQAKEELVKAQTQQPKENIADQTTASKIIAPSHPSTATATPAAESAIAKAQAKSDAQASMTEDEKTQAQIESLKKRLDKAKARLDTAIEENSEHIDAYREAIVKLRQKLSEYDTL